MPAVEIQEFQKVLGLMNAQNAEVGVTFGNPPLGTPLRTFNFYHTPKMLTLLTNLSFPITPKQCDSLITNMVQLNLIDGALHDRAQKALDIVFDTYELKAKSDGRHDYTGLDGHNRLIQEATTFVPESVVTRHRDLAAAHLAIAFNNAQVALQKKSMPLLPAEIPLLLELAKDIVARPMRTEEKMGLYLSYLQKKA